MYYMSIACRLQAQRSKPGPQRGSIGGWKERFRVSRAMRLARSVSRRLPVPPCRIEHLAFCSSPVGIVVRQPAPLPGHPLPTTGLGGREVAFSVRRSDGAVSVVQGGGAEPAVDGEGSGVVWVLGSVSVSDEGAGREVDVSRKKQ